MNALGRLLRRAALAVIELTEPQPSSAPPPRVAGCDGDTEPLEERDVVWDPSMSTESVLAAVAEREFHEALRDPSRELPQRDELLRRI